MGRSLAAWGLGWRVVKTALAAGLAWEIATRLPGGDLPPFFAPLAAVLTMQITIVQSVSRAMQRLLGLVVGVTLGLLFAQVTGVHSWSISLVVLTALVIAIRLQLGAQAIPEAAVGAILVLVVGAATPTAFALSRIVETVVGVLVGVTVNALIIPPSYLPEVRAALAALVEATRDVLDVLASGLASGTTWESAEASLERARSLVIPLARAQEALDRADESLRFNAFGAADRKRLARYRLALEFLERTVIEVRGMARTVRDTLNVVDTVSEGQFLSSAEMSVAFGELLRCVVKALQELMQLADGPGSEARERLNGALSASMMRRREVTKGLSSNPARPDDWIRLGALLSDTDRILAELPSVASELGERG